MKFLCCSLVLAVTLSLCACPLENDARDTAAALQGSLLAAQAKYQASCSANPNQGICQKINNGVAAQNALITATQAYCGWSSISPPPDQTVKCVPIKGAAAAFQAAIANAKQITTEIKGAV